MFDIAPQAAVLYQTSLLLLTMTTIIILLLHVQWRLLCVILHCVLLSNKDPCDNQQKSADTVSGVFSLIHHPYSYDHVSQTSVSQLHTHTYIQLSARYHSENAFAFPPSSYGRRQYTEIWTMKFTSFYIVCRCSFVFYPQ